MNMRTVNEVSKITGVSVRTLHHYDAIGLLKPTKVTNAGYRLYDDTALGRLQSILLFRELQYRHIGELIAFAREIQQKGVNKMNFKAFDKSEIEQYKEEAKSRWGNTKAWQEYEEKEKTGQNFTETADRLMAIFAEIGKLRQMSPSDNAVQIQIRDLQNFITDNYYTCTDEILSSLGQMYVEDPRMKQNIDQAGGIGTAEFVRQAILVYCSK